jgi:2'-5' RNA ligase
VAVDVTPAVRDEVATVTEALRRTGGDVRWVPAENLHVTLKFLGPTGTERLDAVRVALAHVAAVTASFGVVARGIGTFPGAARARVVWVGLSGEELQALAAAVEAQLVSEGFPPEARTFAPHLTIGRVRGPRGWKRVLAAMAPYCDKTFGCSPVQEMVLYQSHLQPQGARYSVLDRFPLRQQDGGGDPNGEASAAMGRRSPAPGGG